MTRASFAFTAVLLFAASAAQAETAVEAPKPPGYHVIKKLPVGEDGGWDYLSVDAEAKRIYITRGNRIMVVELETGKSIGTIEGINGAHGIALVPELNRGFATNGKDGNVSIVDLKTLKVTEQVKAGEKPDAIIYDPASKRVFCFNNDGTTATAIDAATGKVAGTVELGGNPEFGVADGKGKIFVNLEDKSEVAVFDTTKLEVSAHWPLKPGETPTGLALDVEHHRLFSGCRGSKTMVVLDSESGKVIASLPIGAGVDATAFDPESACAFSSNGDGTLTVVHADDANTYRVAEIVQTQPGARTMALEPKSHLIYLIAADQKSAREGAISGFTVYVVGK